MAAANASSGDLRTWTRHVIQPVRKMRGKVWIRFIWYKKNVLADSSGYGLTIGKGMTHLYAVLLFWDAVMPAVSHSVNLIPTTDALTPPKKKNWPQYVFHAVRQQVYSAWHLYKPITCAPGLLSRSALARRFAVSAPLMTLHLLLNGKPITVQEIA